MPPALPPPPGWEAKGATNFSRRCLRSEGCPHPPCSESCTTGNPRRDRKRLAPSHPGRGRLRSRRLRGQSHPSPAEPPPRPASPHTHTTAKQAFQFGFSNQNTRSAPRHGRQLCFPGVTSSSRGGSGGTAPVPAPSLAAGSPRSLPGSSRVPELWHREGGSHVLCQVLGSLRRKVWRGLV